MKSDSSPRILQANVSIKKYILLLLSNFKNTAIMPLEHLKHLLYLLGSEVAHTFVKIIMLFREKEQGPKVYRNKTPKE